MIPTVEPEEIELQESEEMEVEPKKTSLLKTLIPVGAGLAALSFLLG